MYNFFEIKSLGQFSWRYTISEVCTDAKYSVTSRNPIDMFISLGGKNRKYNDENYADYDEIWRKSDIPVVFGKSYMCCSQTCSIGDQLKVLLDTVERRKVFILFLEDMSFDPEMVWVNLQNFLVWIYMLQIISQWRMQLPCRALKY